MFKQILKRLGLQKNLPKHITYQEARGVLESHSIEMRKELAAHEDVEPEMLYYLAEDDLPEVRALVARNSRTPAQADKLLVNDIDDEVRCELARKITRLVPGLSADEATRLREQAIEILEKLAQDSLPRVRQIVAEELKHSAEVPAHIVQLLARDMETIVSTPILEYSPLLADEDLIEIIAGANASEALQAIADRRSVSGPVSDAIVATLDIPAIASLLVNSNAQIREETLDQIIDNAESIDSWHQPLVMRPDLSVRAVRRIAGFVASSLIDILCQRNDLDESTLKAVRLRVRKRIQEEDALANDNALKVSQARQHALEVHKIGRLDSAFIAEAIEAGNCEVVIESLALLTAYPPSVVKRIIDSKQGKAITALTWKAELPMRLALKLQTFIAHVPPQNMLAARNGIDYPLTADEMEWHLNYFVERG